MNPQLILFSFLIYTFLLFVVSWFTSRKSDNDSFFVGNRKSPWYVVAYGMVGASLSGVTFISVPGWVGDTQFSYMMVVLGYVLGYITIATVLLPMYYRLKLTSIYTYLDQRFGFWSHKTGAFYFLLSRVIGASFRMFLVVNVLQIFVFDTYNIPFALTVIIFMLLILLYTFKGGIKTIVWTDSLQTTFMLFAVVFSIVIIVQHLDLSFGDMTRKVIDSKYSQIIFTGWQDTRFFVKQFLSGAFIAIVMTGLDQDMMQKNLSCKTLPDAQKNMISLGFVLVFVNFLFLFLGAILFIYAESTVVAIPDLTDNLFPTIALKHFGAVAGIVFIIGLISAAYSSADSALTALTTSFSIDFLRLEERSISESKKIRIRKIVHLSVAALLILVIIGFRAINNQAVISKLFTIAGYTYGPLLGLYAFGLFSKRIVVDKWVPIIALLSPIICYIVSENSIYWLNGYRFGFELLILNGMITYFGLFIMSNSKNLTKR
ncbi:MAG: sodium:solute symporter [Bacteroidetes bacterium HGW-Bacteroidetes-17]|nr:MAG: sodium:solute symporter [Bacteroidetes bacterium HGW-Bacteroidetes-17]